MTELKCLNKGNTDPRNQIKIYFAAYKLDFSYFEYISEILFDISDYALFFHDPNKLVGDEDDYQKIKLALSMMNVILIPVTKRLISMMQIGSVKHLFGFYLKCAEEYQIPILPLKASGVSDSEFQQHFGSIEYVPFTAKGAVKEGLRSFLNSTTVSHELAERIRSNFKANIFISYRRKDQYKIRLLNDMIYEDEELQGIACWYDEFLTPGENFDNTIMQALKRSDLFLIALTEKMLEEDNYVINIEYPAALELKKPILSVLLEDIDLSKVEEVFDKDVAAPVDIVNTAGRSAVTTSKWYFDYNKPPKELKRMTTEAALALCGKLKELLASKLSREESGEYFFLLGLAYYYGVDVNRSSKTAVNLLKRAIWSGYHPAVVKLNEIDGEAFDSVTESLQNQAADGSSQAAAKLSMMFWSMGEYAFEQNDRHAAEGWRIKAENAISDFSENSADAEILLCKSRLLLLKGKLKLKDCQYNDALKVLKKAVRIAKALDENSDDIELKNHLTDCTNQLDEALLLADSSDGEIDAEDEPVPVHSTPAQGESVRLLLGANNRSIHSNIARGNTESARKTAESSVEIAALLLEKTIPPDGDPDFDLKERLKQPGNYISKKDGYDRLPALDYLAETDRFWYTQIEQYCREKYAEAPTPELAKKMLIAGTKSAAYRVVYELFDPEEKRVIYKKLLDTAKPLQKVCAAEAEDCIFEAYLGLAVCDYEVCKLRRAESICKKLLSRFCESGRCRTEQVAVLRRIRTLTLFSDIAFRRQKLDRSAELCRRAADVYDANPSVQTQEFAQSCSCRISMRLADLYKANNEPEKALKEDETALKKAESIQVGHSHDIIENRLLLVDCYIRLAEDTKSVQDRFDCLSSADIALQTDHTFYAELRKTYINGLRAEAHRKSIPKAELDKMHKGRRSVLLENQYEEMKKAAEKLVYRTKCNSPEALRLLFLAFMMINRYYRIVGIKFRDKYGQQWTGTASLIYTRYRELMTDKEWNEFYKQDGSNSLSERTLKIIGAITLRIGALVIERRLRKKQQNPGTKRAAVNPRR